MKKNKELQQATLKYWPYILEIRKRLISILIVFLFGFGLGFFFFRQVINSLLDFFNFGQARIIITSPFQTFSLAVNIGLILGLLVSAPVLFFNLAGFIKPSLKKNERKMIFPLGIISFLLFIFGSGFGLFLMRWVILTLSQTFLPVGVDNYWDIGAFFSQIFLSAVFLGVIFQFPLVLSFLIKLRLIKIGTLRQKRGFIIVGIFVLVALLPPTDALSLILMSLSLIILFEATLFLLGKTIKGGENLCLAD